MTRPGGVRWTEEEVRLLNELRAKHYTLKKIAAVLGRPYSSVTSKVDSLERHHVRQKPKTDLRPCMCCGRSFKSAGIHNRLCVGCRNKDVGVEYTI